MNARTRTARHTLRQRTRTNRTITPTALGQTTIKLRGRRTKTVPVKLYDQATFTARLATYRPRNAGDARLFEQAAYRLAA